MVIFTRETCSFMTNNKRVMDFEDYYLHTFLPAESFFQTVLMNTAFKDIIVNDDKRAVIEKVFFNKKQFTKDFIDSLRTGNQLFIRKINIDANENIINYIKDSYHDPLLEIDEIERELRRTNQQNN